MLTIRRAEARDAPVIAALVRELAEYEKLTHEAVATEADFLRDGFSVSPPRFRAELAEWGGEVAGFALWFNDYSTFAGRPGLYLEDLFVRPEHRRRGIGKALVAHLARVAVEEGYPRFQWQVLDWNAPSIAFYRGLGAQPHPEWKTMDLTGDALRRLAGAAPG